MLHERAPEPAEDQLIDREVSASRIICQRSPEAFLNDRPIEQLPDGNGSSDPGAEAIHAYRVWRAAHFPNRSVSPSCQEVLDGEMEVK